jgi:malate synthase
MLLAARETRQCDFDAGIKPDFLPETQHIRADSSWKVRPPPKDLLDRHVHRLLALCDCIAVLFILNLGAFAERANAVRGRRASI